MTILLLESSPAHLNGLIHACKHLLQIANKPECTLFHVILVKRFGEGRVHLLEAGELFIDGFRLSDRDSLLEGGDCVIGRHGKILFLAIGGIVFALLRVSDQELALAVHLGELAENCLLLVEIVLGGHVDVELTNLNLHQVNIRVHVSDLVSQIA